MEKNFVNWRKFINWIVFHAIFALFPLLSVWFFRSLLSKTTVESVHDFPEILFFSLVVCASTVGDLRSVDKPKRWTITFWILEAALLIGAIGSAILYGGIRFASIINPEIGFRAQLIRQSIWLTILLFALSVTAQMLRALVDIKVPESDT